MVNAEFLSKYIAGYSDPECAEVLIRYFWRISEFKAKDLKDQLMEVSDDEFEDDYQAFLVKDSLVKAALRMIGADGKLKDIESVLAQSSDPQSRIASVVPMLSGTVPEYIKNLRNDMNEAYDGSDDYFLSIVAEAAILVVLSRKLLNSWSKAFSRICESHPAPDAAIGNMLGMALRGENVISHARGYTHRGFDDAGKFFEKLLNDSDDELSGQIWEQKRKRIMDALAGEL